MKDFKASGKMNGEKKHVSLGLVEGKITQGAF